AVDAIPDIGEKQQIVFTEWMGRSPKEVENQITYPLAALLQGTPGVKTIRSYSYFGASFIYVIFEERENFYDTRSRLLEKLSIARGRLPEGTTPVLGPDATGLGQIFWYTLEGEGFSPAELRSFQDWNLRYALQSCPGVSEVASIGGFTREYQIDVDPEKLRLFRIPLEMVQEAVRDSNIDVGAMTIDVNRVEYMIRGLGAIHSLSDVENIPLRAEGMRPVRVKDVAHVSVGPALRRGILDKAGREAVGGVVVARYGANPMEVIQGVKAKIAELKSQLPEKILADGRVSKLEIAPFYDRSILIDETLDTLKKSLEEEILITIIVVLVMIFHFRVSFLISLILPLGVLITFVLMKVFGVESNVMSLSGIAIAIGAMVDMGIITLENLTKVMREAEPEASPRELIARSAAEVGPAILTSSLTIIVSFLPIFWLTGAEGKMFTPLAWTKTFAISASVVLALTLLPILAELILFRKKSVPRFPNLIALTGLALSVALAVWIHLGLGVLLAIYFLSR
ncbi:MAG: efflux RND transporter permease subunit, partial [Spirochaetia bacterium]|nr:efflux RND transporter permease subunit [Spirochaetia bacterium]